MALQMNHDDYLQDRRRTLASENGAYNVFVQF